MKIYKTETEFGEGEGLGSFLDPMWPNMFLKILIIP